MHRTPVQTPPPIGTAAPQCLGCKDCQGLCRQLLEMATLPQVVLHRVQRPS